jgi:hypothetical protein
MTQEDIGLMKDLAATVEHELTALHMAIVDGLTGLVNRRGFETLAQNGLNVCKRMQRPASLLFFDLDGFKAINDKFGHAEGDLALRNFASALKQTFRSTEGGLHDVQGGSSLDGSAGMSSQCCCSTRVPPIPARRYNACESTSHAGMTQKSVATGSVSASAMSIPTVWRPQMSVVCCLTATPGCISTSADGETNLAYVSGLPSQQTGFFNSAQDLA